MSYDTVIGRPRQSTQLISERGGGPDERKTIKEHGKDLFRYRLLTLAWLMFAIPALAGRYVIIGVVAGLLWYRLIFQYRREQYLSTKAQNKRIGAIVAAALLTLIVVDRGALEYVWLPVWWGWRHGTMPMRIGRQPLIIQGITMLAAWVGVWTLIAAFAIKSISLKGKEALTLLVGTVGLSIIAWTMFSRDLLDDGRLVINPIVVWLPQWMVLVRAFLIVAPPLAWDRSFRFVAWRQVLEIVAPTASSVPVQPIRPSGIQPPRDAPLEYRDADVEPLDSEPDDAIYIENVQLPPEAAQTLARNAESGAPTVVSSGTRNGLGNFELPIDLFGENRREAERNLVTLAHGILDENRPWSRPEWAGDGQPWSAAQWRRLNNWLVDHGLVYKVGPRHNDPHDWNAVGRHLLRTYLDSHAS